MKKSFSSLTFKIALVLLLVNGLQSCIYINTRDNDIPAVFSGKTLLISASGGLMLFASFSHLVDSDGISQAVLFFVLQGVAALIYFARKKDSSV